MADAVRGAPRGRVRRRAAVDDPDGIVVEARFVPPHECDEHLLSCAPWVREPLSEWLRDRWLPHDRRGFDYQVSGTSRDSMRVVRGAPT
jgi:hypothetical protein